MLPYSNQRQDEYRNVIKGRAPGDHIYHYNYFDPNLDLFGGISIFEFKPNTFELNQWVFATRGSSAFEFFDKLGAINRLSPFHCRLVSQPDFRIRRYLDAATRENVENTETSNRLARRNVFGSIQRTDVGSPQMYHMDLATFDSK